MSPKPKKSIGNLGLNMDYKIFYSEQAKRDITEIFEYILADSERHVNLLREKILHSIERLAFQPKIGVLAPESSVFNKTIRHLVVHKNYRVLYSIDEEAKNIFVISVRHCRQNIE